ncbi:hypothetical protein AB0G73_21940 [Streptomyces sp. NPDC020719]|uniref:hypothetical protein n=1 Tax=unclassified Streptomyces TaxID=2593676 RepID=UPI0033EA1CA2
MKSTKPMHAMKAAAIVAGSLAVAGAASPAFASGGFDTAGMAPTSLNGGLETLASRTLADPTPTIVQTQALDPTKSDSLFHTVAQATGGLNKTNGIAPAGLLGGLPVGH